MMPRKMRIGVSVFFGLLTVALCVPWVRSYRFGEIVYRSVGHDGLIIFGSNYGVLYVVRHDRSAQLNTGWPYGSAEATPSWKNFDVGADGSDYQIMLPYCSLFAALAAAAAIPWGSVKFPLRTLLIATTLVAVVLGLAVWATR